MSPDLTQSSPFAGGGDNKASSELACSAVVCSLLKKVPYHSGSPVPISLFQTWAGTTKYARHIQLGCLGHFKWPTEKYLMYTQLTYMEVCPGHLHIKPSHEIFFDIFNLKPT